MPSFFITVVAVPTWSGISFLHIQDDVEAAHENVVEGHSHLSTYYDIVKSNRSMIIKIFAILIVVIWLLLVMF